MEHGSTVEERIEQLELALLEQEHRLFHVLFNFFTLRPALGVAEQRTLVKEYPKTILGQTIPRRMWL